MKDRMDEMADDIREMKESIEHLVSIANQGKGSLKTLFAVGSVAGAMGSGLAWLFGAFHK